MQFSIIVPVYNVEKYLEGCLDSIINQSFKEYEVILVDDGSGDTSGEICDRYASRHDRIRVVHQVNQGLSGARNTGLDHAAGEWIVFVDSDDRVEPDLLELLNDQISLCPADLYCYNARKVNAQGEETERLLYAVENETVTFSGEKDRFAFFFDRFMQYQTGWEVCFRIFRRSLIEAHGLRFVSTREVFAEDYLFTFQYLLYAKRLRFLCNICYNYFQRDSSLLGSLDPETVLPRLITWGLYGYESILRSGLKLFRKDYDRLYFMLLNHHLQYLLANLPQEKVRAYLWDPGQNRRHRRWMKQMKKDQADLNEYMIKVRWL